MAGTTPDPSDTQQQDSAPDLDPQEALTGQSSEHGVDETDEVTDPSDPNWVEPFDGATRPAGG